jgi:ABC-type sugar transport system substrate-binding protein
METTEFVEAGKIGTTIAQNDYDTGYLSVEQAQKAIKKSVAKRGLIVGLTL